MRIEEVAQIRYRIVYGDTVLWYDTKEEALEKGKKELLKRFFAENIGENRGIMPNHIIEFWDDIKYIMEADMPKNTPETRKISV